MPMVALLHKNCTNCQSRRKWTLGISHTKKQKQFMLCLWGHWHIAAVTARCANRLCPICKNRSRVVAKSAKTEEPVLLYINGCVTLQTVALRQPIFKQKKGSPTISLGLRSMGSSQPSSRDTIPCSSLTAEEIYRV
jgi:hypothetical protein